MALALQTLATMIWARLIFTVTTVSLLLGPPRVAMCREVLRYQALRRIVEKQTQGSVLAYLNLRRIARDRRRNSKVRDLSDALSLLSVDVPRAKKALQSWSTHYGEKLPGQLTQLAAGRLLFPRADFSKSGALNVANWRTASSNSIKSVHALARNYIRYMHRFNTREREVMDGVPGAMWTSRAKHRGWSARGKVAYWDLDRDTPGLDLVGLVNASPFSPREGVVRIFNHYMDKERHALLVKRYGSPSGQVDAEMTSSYRTLMLYPEDAAPFMLKFSGDGWYLGSKKLTRDHVESSVERSLQMSDFVDLQSEPAGIVLERGKNVHTVIYRPLPLPVRRGLKKGDVLLTAHSLLAPAFAKSDLGKKIFASSGSRDAWLAKHFVPHLVRTIWRSMRVTFTHYELHDQNVDVTINARGEIVDFRIKDILDVMHDPLARLSQGTAPLYPELLREPTWGDMNGSTAAYEANDFHQKFFAVIAQNIPLRAFAEQFVKLVDKRYGLKKLERYPEVQNILERRDGRVELKVSPVGASYPEIVKRNTIDAVCEMIAAVRSAMLKQNIAERFRPDKRAKRAFLTGKGQIFAHSPQRARAGDNLKNDTINKWYTFGYVGNFPAAVYFNEKGLLDAYCLRQW